MRTILSLRRFRRHLYTEGRHISDEEAWAAIENSVLEFDSPNDALAYYQKEFLPHPQELARRQFFIQNRAGVKVGTTSAWWDEKGPNRTALLHWVSVRPEYQGLGLGKALVSYALQEMHKLEGDVDVYLHTQTWSYMAIGVYLRTGFKLLPQGAFAQYKKNEYDLALPILKAKMTPETFALIAK